MASAGIKLISPEETDVTGIVFGDLCLAVNAASLYFRVGNDDDTDSNMWRDPTVTHPVQLHILYFDDGTEDIQIGYTHDGTTETVETVVTKTNTLKWMWKYYILQNSMMLATSFYINNNLADFRLYSSGVLEISSINLSETNFQMDAFGLDGALFRKDISSDNFITGASGWQITRDGEAEFQDVTVRGTIYADEGSLGSVFIGSALTLSSGANIHAGQTAWDTGIGFWFENNDDNPRVSIGDSNNDKFTWDASNILLTGTVNINGGEIRGSMDMTDDVAGFYNGTGTFTTPTTGLKYWSQGGFGRIMGFNSGAEQAGWMPDGSFGTGFGGTVGADVPYITFNQSGMTVLGEYTGGTVYYTSLKDTGLGADSSAVGSVTWTGTTNIYTNNGAYATAALNGGGSTNTGATSPTANSTNDSTVGVITWSGLGNVQAHDTNFATAALTTTSSGHTTAKAPVTVANDATHGDADWTNLAGAQTEGDSSETTCAAHAETHYLKCTLFNMSIPSGATPSGVIVKVKKRAFGGQTGDVHVRLVVGGSVVGNDYRNATDWPTTLTWFTYGSSTDLWGLTLTDSQVNASSFGFIISATVVTGGVQQFIDAVTVQVYYTINNDTSEYLKTTNFGFAIPAGATINGIVAEIEYKSSVASAVIDYSVKIIKGGTISGTDKKKSSSTYWPTTQAYTSYGASGNLWGLTWTYSDINASTFGVAISAKTISAATASINHVRITVYYTTSGGDTSHYLKATTFGFAVPSTATIDGVQVDVLHQGGTASNINDNLVKIIKGAGPTYSNDKGSASYWPTSFAYASYGGSADLWGLTLTYAEVNATTFGVVVSAKAAATPDSAYIDHIRITVFYHIGASSISPVQMGGARIQNMGDGILATDAATVGQLSGASTVVYNIKDYGALVDGSTDDTVAINAATSAAAAAGGGTVYFPGGTTIINPYSQSGPFGTQNYGLFLRAYVTWLGDGMGVSIIKLKNSATTPYHALVENITQSGTTDTNITIKDLTLDGNKSNQSYTTFQDGLRLFSVPNFRAERLEVKNIRYDNGTNEGFGMEFGNAQSKNIVLLECVFSGVDGSGVAIETGVTHVLMQNCRATSNLWNGFATNHADTITMENCIADSNTLGGFNSEVDTGMVWVGCISELNGNYGFATNQTTDSIITGNVVRDNGDTGIMITSTTVRCIITNNHVYDSGTANQNYGIRETSSSKNNIIRDNNVYNNVTTDYTLLSNGATTATSGADIAVYVDSNAGSPTSTPMAQSSRVPLAVDTTNGKIYGYYSSAWNNLSAAGGSGASASDAFVTIGHPSDLTGERALTGTTNQITVTDNGANSTVVLSTPQNLDTATNFQVGTLGIGAGDDTTANMMQISGTQTSSSGPSRVMFINTTLKPMSANDAIVIDMAAVTVDTTAGNLNSVYGYKGGGFSKTGANSITNSWGLYIAASTIATNNYAAYFGDKVGIGTTVPSSLLTLSSTAPTFRMIDTTASAKSLLVTTDANKTVFDEAGGATTNLLVLDLTNGRVGINNVPSYPLEVQANGTFGMLKLQNSGASGWSSIDFYTSGGTQIVNVGYGNASASSFPSSGYLNTTNSSTPFIFAFNNTEKFRLATDGSITASTVIYETVSDYTGTHSTLDGVTVTSAVSLYNTMVTPAATTSNAVDINAAWAFGSNPGAHQYYGMRVYSGVMSGSVSHATAVIRGAEISVEYSSSGALSQLSGLLSHTKNGSSATVSNANGHLSAIDNTSTGTLTIAYGFYSSLNNTGGGVVTDYRGYNVTRPVNTGSTITTTYGVYIDNMTAAAGTQTNTPYGLYQVGTADYNYFGGKVGIGQTTPTALLELASSAPTFRMTDTTASAKSMLVTVDANVASFYEASATLGSMLNLDMTNTRLGFGTTAPADYVEIVRDGAAGNLFMTSYSTNPSIVIRRANGSLASPTKMLANDTIGFVGARGFDATPAFSSGSNAAIQFNAAEDFNDSSHHGAYMIFFTTSLATSSRAERMRIDSQGNVIVNTAAIAINATDGFLYIDSMAGAPTGVPTTYSGRIPMTYNTVSDEVSFYNSGWKTIQASGSSWARPMMMMGA